MNSELVYAFLMGMGWFFLVGWVIALGVAYVKAFQESDPSANFVALHDRRARSHRSEFPAARGLTAVDRR